MVVLFGVKFAIKRRNDGTSQSLLREINHLLRSDPRIVYTASEPGDDYKLGDYRDKVLLGWRYTFSEDAQIRVSISHEVAEEGFGGGAVQFQMFF